MQNRDITTHKFVAVLNKKIDFGKVLNALGHMSLGLVAAASPEQKEQMAFMNYVDANENIHPSLSKNSFIVLRADNSNQIRTARKAAVEKGLLFVDFADSMQEGSYLEQLERVKNLTEEELNYVGICMFGSIDFVSEITKKFRLWV